MMQAPDGSSRQKIRVGLLGFGKAGQAVCRELMAAPDVSVAWVMRRRNSVGPDFVESVVGEIVAGACTPLLGMEGTDFQRLLRENPVDFLVDFSGAGSCRHYAAAAAAADVGIVSAISNCSPEELAILQQAALRTRVLHSPNMTVGINFIMLAAKVLRRLAPHADVEIIEEHFRGKEDVSGTARRLARALGIDEATHVNSVRVGGIVGRHEVVFGFPFQTLRLVHDSISRQAFGQGALFALRGLAGRAPGFYTMEQLVGEGFANAIDGVLA